MESEARTRMLVGGESLRKEEVEAKKVDIPYLTNLHEDRMFDGQIIHFLESGESVSV